MESIFDSIEKPTLLLDEAAARANIRRMTARMKSAGVRFRPHFKTHQSAEIGEWFRGEGVNAITVSSVEMAQYFAAHGWDDITIAFPVNLRQSRELNDLARQTRLGLLVESAEAVRRLAETLTAPVDLWLKVDVGAHRTGLPWDQPEAAAQVLEAVRSAPPGSFRLRGLLTHAGFTYAARGADEVCRRSSKSLTRIEELRSALTGAGFDPLEISVGDTPAASLCAIPSSVDELRPGNFVFFDAQQVQIGSCGWQDVAVALACPVVAKHPDRCQVVVYGGAVHLSKDYLVEGEQRSYGAVCLPEGSRWGAPLAGAYTASLSQEHGIIQLSPADLDRVQIGGLLCILPAHSCLTVTLMKRYLTLDGRMIDTMNV